MKPNMTTRLLATSVLLGGVMLTGCAVDSGNTRSDVMAPAQQSSEVMAIQGMPARSLDSEMNRLGFSNTGGYKTDNASFTTWWNPQGEQCVNVETRDGRVASVESIFKGNCL